MFLHSFHIFYIGKTAILFQFILFRIKSVKGERRLCYRAYRQRQQGQFIIVPGYPVLFQSAATGTPVDEYPFVSPSHGYSHRLHNAAAGRGTVARPDIQMHASQAPRTVITVFGARCCHTDATPAIQADKLFFGMFIPNNPFDRFFRYVFVHTIILTLNFLSIPGNESKEPRMYHTRG